MKKLITILFVLLSISMFSQVNVFSVNSGGNLKSSVGIPLGEGTNTGIISIINTDGTIDVQYINENVNIKIFPNPTTDYINIQSDEDVNYSLLDMSGKLVLSGNEKLVNVSNLKNGLYILMIKGKSIKIIKQ